MATKNWLPNSVETVLNISPFGLVDILIISFDELDPYKIKEDMENSKYVGLTIIEEPLVVCLTTQYRIYILRMLEPRHISFFRAQLQNESITYFIFDGAYFAQVLKQHTNIELGNHKNVIDLVAFDLQVRLSKLRVEERGRVCTIQVIYNKKLRQMNYEELAEYWLHVSNVNFNCSNHELEAIKRFPYSTEAKNAIKKKSALCRVLGVAISEEFDRIVDSRSRDLFSFAIRANDRQREEFERATKDTFANFCQYLQQCSATEDLRR